jgi:hypothetical protein
MVFLIPNYLKSSLYSYEDETIIKSDLKIDAISQQNI